MHWVLFSKSSFYSLGFAITTCETGEKIITDKLDGQGAWFGVIHEGRVIAGCRRLHRDASGHLDLTRYPSSQKPRLASLVSADINPNLGELQRTVINPEFRGNSILSSLFHYVFKDSYDLGLNLIGSAGSAKLKTILQHHLKLRNVDSEFYYTENLEGPADVFYVAREEIPRVLQIFGNMVRHGNGCWLVSRVFWKRIQLLFLRAVSSTLDGPYLSLLHKQVLSWHFAAYTAGLHLRCT